MASRMYNPGFLTDDELAAAFCVRTSEFESIVETLQENTGNSNQHLIVIGPRGSGKTILLLRVALEVRRHAELADRLLPVVFSEESYSVSTCGEFWLECLARLAAQESRAEDGRDLHATYQDLRGIQDEQTLAQRCLGAVLDVADRACRRLVLVVENLNMLLGEMADPDAGWQLRKTLQTEPRIMLLGSATSRFAQIDDPDHALYHLFRIITLRPLDEQECATLWRAVSGASADRGKIRSLQILTGGSPRLMAIVARFGAEVSFPALMSDLFDLIDAHTEYFKRHIEDLPPQERRVFVALADLWKPATTREIADRARIATSQCSALLQRLAARGAVTVHGGTPRRKQYYLVERMYNIYYLLRRGDPGQVVEALLRFMASFYAAPERLPEAVDAGDDVVERYDTSDIPNANSMAEAAVVRKGWRSGSGACPSSVAMPAFTTLSCCWRSLQSVTNSLGTRWTPCSDLLPTWIPDAHWRRYCRPKLLTFCFRWLRRCSRTWGSSLGCRAKCRKWLKMYAIYSPTHDEECDRAARAATNTATMSGACAAQRSCVCDAVREVIQDSINIPSAEPKP